MKGILLFMGHCPKGSFMFRVFLVASIAVGIMIMTGQAESAEMRGRFSLEELYISDTSSALDRNQFTSRLAMDSVQSEDKDTFGFHLDLSLRKKIGGEDSASDLKNERINTLSVEYTGLSDSVYLAAGRLWPKEIGVERVDGINFLFHKGAGGAGMFGGAKPDPYTEGFNKGFTTAGGYFFYKEKKLNANLALVHNEYKGKTDRQYVYSFLTWHPYNELHFFSILTADRDERGKRLKISNGIFELTLRQGFDKSVTIGYSEFRAFKLLESMNYEIDSSLQRACYVKGHYFFLNRYTLYGKYEKQYMNYETAPVQEAYIRQVGLSNSNFLGKAVRIDMNMIQGDREDTSYLSYAAEIGFDLTEKLQLTLNGSTVKTEYAISKEKDDQKSYGLSGYYRYNKSWNFLINLEVIDGEGYTTKTALWKFVYKF